MAGDDSALMDVESVLQVSGVCVDQDDLSPLERRLSRTGFEMPCYVESQVAVMVSRTGWGRSSGVLRSSLLFDRVLQ